MGRRPGELVEKLGVGWGEVRAKPTVREGHSCICSRDREAVGSLEGCCPRPEPGRLVRFLLMSRLCLGFW